MHKRGKKRIKQANVPGSLNARIYAKQKINLTWPKSALLPHADTQSPDKTECNQSLW